MSTAVLGSLLRNAVLSSVSRTSGCTGSQLALHAGGGDLYDSALTHPEVPSLFLELHYGLEGTSQRVTALDPGRLWAAPSAAGMRGHAGVRAGPHRRAGRVGRPRRQATSRLSAADVDRRPGDDRRRRRTAWRRHRLGRCAWRGRRGRRGPLRHRGRRCAGAGPPGRRRRADRALPAADPRMARRRHPQTAVGHLAVDPSRAARVPAQLRARRCPGPARQDPPRARSPRATGSGHAGWPACRPDPPAAPGLRGSGEPRGRGRRRGGCRGPTRRP